MNWELVCGIDSLGRGCPFYKHSKCDEVPWPRVNVVRDVIDKIRSCCDTLIFPRGSHTREMYCNEY